MPSLNKPAAGEILARPQTSNVSPSRSSNPRKKWRVWAGACFAIVLLAAFAQPLLELVNYAAGSELFSYILLVPFVSGYLLYLRRDQLPKKHEVDLPMAIGFLVIGLSIFAVTFRLDFAGQAPAGNGRVVLLSLSFLCCLAGGGFLFLGRSWMRAAAFPLAYLIFMVPMPDAMTNALETASKYASAEMTNLFFYVSGTPFVRAGVVFQLPNITIEVAQECSGIRSSWVLFMTSIVAANLFLQTSWRRFALVAFVIPLGIVRNGFRVWVIGTLCIHFGPQMIHSPIHRKGGPLFFVLSLVPLFLFLFWLRRGDGKGAAVGGKAEIGKAES
jgi:exosortase C (VPDSG-CTERM-specific)